MATSDPTEGARAHKRGDRHHEPFEERVKIDPSLPVELAISNVLGDIAVRASDRPDVRIHADRAGGVGRDLRLDFEFEENHNRIQIRSGASWSFDLGDFARGLFGRGKPGPSEDAGDEVAELERERRPGRGHRCDILVEIPRAAVETAVKLRAAAGDVTVEGLAGEIGVGAASGEVALRRLSGSISAQTASGDIAIAEVEGEVRARSASGDVRVSRSDLERGTLQTASGDIQVDRSRLLAAGPLKIDTVSGDVSLDIGLAPAVAAQGATLEFKTVSGDAQVSPPLVGAGKRTWHLGPAGEGCAQLAVRSVSGDLAVKLAADVAESPLPPGQPRRSRTGSADRAADAGRDWIAGVSIPPQPPVPPVPPVPPTPPDPGFTDPFAHTSPNVEAALRDTERAQEDAWHAVEDAERAAVEATVDAELAIDEARRATEDTDRDSLAGGLPAPSSDADRLAILTALERGEIDIDEALRRLEPLGGEGTGLSPLDRSDER